MKRSTVIVLTVLFLFFSICSGCSTGSCLEPKQANGGSARLTSVTELQTVAFLLFLTLGMLLMPTQ